MQTAPILPAPIVPTAGARRVWGELLVALLVLAARCLPVHAQESEPVPIAREDRVALRLPLELAHGPSFAAGDAGARYGFSGSFLPGFSYGRLELGASAAGLYRNPSWDMGLGARASFAALSAAVGLLRVRVAAEAQYLLRARGMRLAFALMPDVASFARVGLWFGRDVEARSFFLQFAIATDFTTWQDPVGALIASGPMQDSRDGRP